MQYYERAGRRAPDMYYYTFREGAGPADWSDFSPFAHVARDKGIPPMLLYYVAGREGHAIENERFAERLRAEGCTATVLAAADKTHLRIELEIGARGDVPTKEIMAFIEATTKAK